MAIRATPNGIASMAEWRVRLAMGLKDEQDQTTFMGNPNPNPNPNLNLNPNPNQRTVRRPKGRSVRSSVRPRPGRRPVVSRRQPTRVMRHRATRVL